MKLFLKILDKIKNKWKVKSNFQFILIMIVFAVTGSLSLIIANLLLPIIFNKVRLATTLKIILRIVFIFPIYQLIILIVAFCFGQFNFFWKFEKKMFSKIFKRIK